MMSLKQVLDHVSKTNIPLRREDPFGDVYCRVVDLSVPKMYMLAVQVTRHSVLPLKATTGAASDYTPSGAVPYAIAA
jgi:hypothetical protein